MKFSGRNTVLAFVWVAVALLAFLALPTSFGGNLSAGEAYSADYALALDNVAAQPSGDAFLDSDSPLKSPLFLGSRRPLSQMSLRPQRGSLVYGLNGRDGAIVKHAGIGFTKSVSTPCSHRAGFPSPLSYRVPKEYYVFTLGRILC